MDPVRVVLTGGGTGGHVYPALAIAGALRERPPDPPEVPVAERAVELCYVGNSRGVEAELVPAAGLTFAGVEAGAVRGRTPLGIGRSLFHIGRGFNQAVRHLRTFGADVVLATGGYVCVPVALAARRLRVPVVLYLPDRRPGWAIKALSYVADAVAVTTAAAADSLPADKVIETGYPVRTDILVADRTAAQATLGLSPNLPTIVVLGGSRGARSINEAITGNLRDFLAAAQIVHAAGRADYDWLAVQRRDLPGDLRDRYHLFPYLGVELADALAAADLAISRAGASVLGEYPARGIPAILVPYPHAGAHQEFNADYLTAAGAAIKLRDRELDRLWPLVRDLLDDRGRLSNLAAASARLARPDAARAIARLTLEWGLTHHARRAGKNS